MQDDQKHTDDNKAPGELQQRCSWQRRQNELLDNSLFSIVPDFPFTVKALISEPQNSGHLSVQHLCMSLTF